MRCLVKPDMNRHDPMLRAQRKKILLLEGALHRLELVEAKAAIKGSLQTSPMAALIKPALTLERLLPLAGSLLPLVVGSGRVSVWLRRAVAAAGAAAVVMRLLQNLRQPADDDKLD
jgi:hypothetical protein